MKNAIQSLQQVRDYCAVGRGLPSELQAWLALSLGRYLNRDCENLNEAFGVVQGHGGIPWWRELAMRDRDRALRRLAKTHFPDLDSGERARLVARISQRYATACWPRDKRLEAMPESYLGTPKENLWHAFRSGAKMPLCERRLRTLLSD